jgi:fructose-1,6-bisphosphatase/inositol monophosphatase family enzyme
MAFSGELPYGRAFQEHIMQFTAGDLDTLAEVVMNAAEREIMPRFRKLEASDIREKTSALDLVTDADEAAEAHITLALTKAFPGALVIGEEAVEKDRGLLSRIVGADLAFIIDPIDGTSNFAWGLPLFGVLAAVTSRGETIAGLIYDPVGRDFRLAMRGQGAFARTAHGTTHRISVSSGGRLTDLTGTTSWYLMPEPQRSHVAANLAKVRACFAYRCAAYEYRIVAEGRVDFSLHYKLMPWDHAAGVLIHQEAGGYSALLDGSPYRPTIFEGGILSAPNREIWGVLRDALLAGPG